MGQHSRYDLRQDLLRVQIAGLRRQSPALQVQGSAATGPFAFPVLNSSSCSGGMPPSVVWVIGGLLRRGHRQHILCH